MHRSMLSVLLLAAAACGEGLTGPRARTGPLGPIDPRRAQEASVDCPSRCGWAIGVTPGGGQPRIFGVTEDAVVQGAYGETGVWFARDVDGTRATALGAQPPAFEPSAWTGNGWGQTVGWIFAPVADGQAMFAAAWEPDGSLAFVRGGPDARRVNGYAQAVSVNSVIVGTGKLEGDAGAWRPFRYHWQDGVEFLSPEGTMGSVGDVNGDGTIVGTWSPVVQNATPTWFIWTRDGGRQDMGEGTAYAISETGYIAGSAGSMGGGFLRTPQGETLTLPTGWQAVDVNHWGEVLLQANSLLVAPPGDCGAAVWYRGYGLLKLTSPIPDATECRVGAINSWGDVAGTVVRRTESGGQVTTEQLPVVWTWQGNEQRYVR